MRDRRRLAAGCPGRGARAETRVTRRVSCREQRGETTDQAPVALRAADDEQSPDVPARTEAGLGREHLGLEAAHGRATVRRAGPRPRRRRPRDARPVSGGRRSTAGEVRRPTARPRVRRRQPPGIDVAMTRFWRRRCSRSRGRSAPGACSRNAASWSPTAAAHAAQVSMPVSDPCPPSSLETSAARRRPGQRPRAGAGRRRGVPRGVPCPGAGQGEHPREPGRPSRGCVARRVAGWAAMPRLWRRRLTAGLLCSARPITTGAIHGQNRRRRHRLAGIRGG